MWKGGLARLGRRPFPSSGVNSKNEKKWEKSAWKSWNRIMIMPDEIWENRPQGENFSAASPASKAGLWKIGLQDWDVSFFFISLLNVCVGNLFQNLFNHWLVGWGDNRWIYTFSKREHRLGHYETFYNVTFLLLAGMTWLKFCSCDKSSAIT